VLAITQLAASLGSLPERGLLDAIGDAWRLGFRSVELLAFDGHRHGVGRLPGFWFDRMSEAERKRLAAAVERFATVTVHAPFQDLSLLSYNPGVRAETRRQIVAAMDATRWLGGIVCTVHLNSPTFASFRDCWQEAVDCLGDLGEHARQRDIKVALETLYPDIADDYCGLIEAVDHDHIGACIDVGHLVAYYPENLRGTPQGTKAHNDMLMGIVRRLTKKLVAFHLHDVRAGDFRDHRAPGRGIIDFERLLGYLSDIDYKGPMALELEEPDVEPALLEGKAYLESMMKRIRTGSPSE